MTTFPDLPHLQKDAIVELGPSHPLACVIVFQYRRRKRGALMDKLMMALGPAFAAGIAFQQLMELLNRPVVRIAKSIAQTAGKKMGLSASVIIYFLLLFFLCFGPQRIFAQCNDSIPNSCNEVLFLGEDKEGCACFICNPNDPVPEKRKKVCSNDGSTKKRLYMIKRYKPSPPK